MVRFKAIEKAEFLQQVNNTRNLVERPALASLVILPKVNVELRRVFFDQTLCFKYLKQVRFPVK